ncbi:MAG: hypothetical protein ACOH2T_18810 [Pseudomonas sp.]
MSSNRLSEQQVEYLWSPEVYEPQWKSEVRDRLKLVIGDAFFPLAKWLLGKSTIREVRVEHVRELEQQLGKDHALRNMLRSITQRLKGQIPKFPLARIAIEVQRAANPINPDIYTAQRLQRSSQLLKSLQQGLKNVDVLEQEERIGLVLMSAAYGGGLMDIAQLRALVEITPERIEWIGGVPEIRLPLSIRGNAQAEYRQWFPDPATLALLIRCSDDLQDMNVRLKRSGTMLKCARAFLLKVGTAERDLPASLMDLLNPLRMQMQLRLPQLLANFAARQGFLSQSLRPSSWGEMFGCPSLEDPAGTYGDRLNRDEDGKEKEDAPDWLLELCRQIRAGELVERPSETPEFEGIIREWVEYMVSGSSAYGHAFERSSIARYVRLLGALLTSQLDGVSIFDVETDALENVYESVLEAQDKDGKRRTLAKAIHEFHTFLQRRYSYPPISPYALLGIGKGVALVDARILCEEQFHLVLQALGTCGLELRTPRLVTAARLFLILGFRLGLRRNEALKLRLRDLYAPVLPADEHHRIQARHPNRRRLSSDEIAGLALPVDLLVRPHAQRGLKTQNATRRLPLHVLLEPDELQLLLDWYRERQEEEAASPTSEYLFCIPQLRTRWISESYLLPALHGCMRAITGCEFAHYHHLRHSCATWLMLKLMSTVSGTSSEIIFRELPRTTCWLKDDRRLRSALLSDKSGPTRRIVHIVSAILGHGSPKTTLLHYVHSLPQIMAMVWQWNPRNWLFSAHNVAAIAEVSQPTMKTKSGDSISVESLSLLDIISRVRPLKDRRRRNRVSRCQLNSVEKHWAIVRIRAVESMLAYASYAEQTGREVNLDWVEFSEEDRALMLGRARYIRDMQHCSIISGPKSRHRLQSTLHANDLSYTSLLPSPPKHGGRDAVAKYAQRLYELLEGPNSERVQRVIDDFTERCWTTETTLRFYRDRDEGHALDYLWLLTAIGIPARYIELIIYDTSKPKATKCYWRQRLGNIRRPISQHVPENPDVENLHLGVRATLEVTDEEVRRNHHSGAALRYLILMASIDWHFRR